MARPKKSEALDLTQAVNLTAGAIERLACRTDAKSQAFLRDTAVPGLRVRVTNTGAKSFVFEAKLNRQTIRRTIGDVRAWTIEQARAEARRLAVLLDEGNDPRELERQRQAEEASRKTVEQAQAVTVSQAWTAYLQTLLLTGARPGEVLGLRWSDLNEQWKGLAIRDKVEGERVIPLTPYVHALLTALPRRNEWVFSSPASAAGVLTIPRNHHVDACKVAGLDGLTLHGLRRSFASLTEWLEIPAGVVAQIQGHKPSATAEKDYKRRPLDLLRLHHERIEAWVLEQAGIAFDAKAEPGKLRVVAA
jgi:integrase